MAMNDNGWGNNPGGGNKGGNQGPPDLEEIWRDFNRRLTGMFGNKRGGGTGGNGGGMPTISPRQFGGGLGVVLGLILLLWSASGFYIVDASQRGVVLQFGRFKEITEPGLRWRLPWPVQTHETVNLSGVRTIEIGYRSTEKNRVPKEALMLTDDENIVSVQFAVQYLLRVRQKNEGQAYANDVVPKARGTASRLFEEASGYKQRIVAMAEGDASRFKQILTEYQKAPEVTRQRLYLETMQQVYSNTSKVMVDAKGQGNLLYLPLDKLMQATAGATAANAAYAADAIQLAAPAGSNAVSSAPTAHTESPPQTEKAPAVERGSDGRSRDGLRSRDRGER